MWPRVTVLTVVRNDRDGFARTLASVAIQDYPNLEYVVIDGASTDGTVEVIVQNKAVIDNWLSEPDRGLYDAMNKGKALATGEFALFLNAGDTFVAIDAVRRLLTPCPPSDTVVFGNVLLSSGSRQWRVPPKQGGRAVLPKGYLPHHQTILYPRSFFRLENYDLQFRIVADADYTCRAVNRCPAEHRDVDLVQSTLGGFTFTMHSSLRGALRMNRERQIFYRKYAVKYSYMHAIRLGVMTFAKYLSVRVGGIAMATRLMHWKTQFGPTRSLGHSECKRP